jgi:hypothetical protein
LCFCCTPCLCRGSFHASSIVSAPPANHGGVDPTPIEYCKFTDRKDILGRGV